MAQAAIGRKLATNAFDWPSRARASRSAERPGTATMQTNTSPRTDAQAHALDPHMPADGMPWRADQQPHGPTIWHDDLLGGVWSPPAGESEDDEQTTVAEIESLIGELVAQLEA